MVKVKMFPAGSGDFLWIAYGKKETLHHILIDGGDKRISMQYSRVLRLIKKKEQVVDAVIFTHIDNDHISGALQALADMEENEMPVIHSIYFNTGSGIRKQCKLEEDVNPEDSLAAGECEGRHSVRSAVSLLRFLEAKNLRQCLNDYVIQGAHECLSGGAELEIISPDEEALKCLLEKWDKESVRSGQDGKQHRCEEGSEVMAGKDISDFLDETIAEDKSITNRSSIAFLFCYDSVKIAFLGDACPSICEKGLDIISKETGEMDLVKVSHHGSGASTSEQLLDRLGAGRYLLSTNGTGNKPSKFTLAKILKNREHVDIYCNYSWWDNIYCGRYFSGKDREEYISSKKLNIVRIPDEGVEIKDGLWIY